MDRRRRALRFFFGIVSECVWCGEITWIRGYHSLWYTSVCTTYCASRAKWIFMQIIYTLVGERDRATQRTVPSLDFCVAGKATIMMANHTRINVKLWTLRDELRCCMSWG